MDKVGPYLLRKYNIKSEYPVMKDLSVQLKNQLHSLYAASLSSRDVLRARDDFRIMRSIQRKLKRQNLIIRMTDKSNIFYIGRAIDFEKKVQAYREKTNAYQELTSNPLEAILIKVTRLLNVLRAKNLIQANQYDEMMPKRATVRLGYMYFNPKVHKVWIERLHLSIVSKDRSTYDMSLILERHTPSPDHLFNESTNNAYFSFLR